MIRYVLLLAMTAIVPMTAQGRGASDPQRPITNDEWCRDYRGDRDRESHCEVREMTLAAPRVLDVTRVSNGSVSVVGGSRADVSIRARVIATAPTVDEARQIAGQVKISTDGGRVTADGPDHERRRSWWVAYRIETPTAIDLELDSANGAISVADVRGRVRANTANGSLRLTDVNGDVDVETSNGSVEVELAGTTWNGTGLRARTSNGSLRVSIPERYNANLRAGTNNGRLSVDFPITVQGRFRDDIETVLGSGGPTIDVRTSNGSLTIARRR